MDSEIQKLIDKIIKDGEQAEKKISSLQKEVQELVAERKSKREEWEEYDRLAEGNLSELVGEITSIQSRLFTGQELIQFIQNK